MYRGNRKGDSPLDVRDGGGGGEDHTMVREPGSYIYIYIYYAQTPQFARTTVKEILQGVLNFNIQREHSACFNRVSR